MKKLIIIAIASSCMMTAKSQSDSLEARINNKLAADKMYKMGQDDAKRYFKGYKAAGTGVLMAGTFLTPVVGLIPAIGSSATPVKEHNLNYPDKLLFENEDYQDGYKAKANSRKKAKTWMNWGISFGTFAVFYGIVSGIVSNSN